MMGVSHEEMKETLVDGGREIDLGARRVEGVLRDAENAWVPVRREGPA